MNYYKLNKPITFEKEHWVLRILLCWLPKQNPDFDFTGKHVAYWYVKLNEGDFVVQEMGFDGSGPIIFKSPYGDNYGYWSDIDGINSGYIENVFDREALSEEEFNRAWES